MSYAYSPCVGRQCLVTFSKSPRVLDERERAVRVIAAIADVESVGEETVSLLLHRVYPHRADVEADDADGQVFDEPEPALELTLRADAILALNPIDEEEEYDDEEDEADEDGLNMDDDSEDEPPLRAVP